jgi:hypothetical protein
MQNDDAKKIIARGRATVERLEAAEDVYAAENAVRDLYQPRREDPPPPVRVHRREGATDTTPERDWSGWDRWAEAHVENGLVPTISEV